MSSFPSSRHAGLATAVLVALVLLVGGLLPLGAWTTAVFAQAPAAADTECRAPLPQAITRTGLGAARLQATRDGCWIFGPFQNRKGDVKTGIAIIRRTGTTFQEVRTVAAPVDPQFVATALSNDERVLVLSSGNQLRFFDVEKLKSGQGDPLLGRIEGREIQVSFGVVITPDDKYVLAVQSARSTVVMVDLAKARSSGFDEKAIVRTLPAGGRPIMAAVSPDSRFLYVTLQSAPDIITPRRICGSGKLPEGAVQVFDLTKAVSSPAATVGFAPAGCGPQNITLSPDGNRLSTTAGSFANPATAAPEHVLSVFDTRPVSDGKAPALVATLSMPALPITVVDTGKRVLVGFLSVPNGAALSPVVVVDATKVESGGAAILGALPIYLPDMKLMADGHTVIGVGPGGILVIDMDRAPVEPLKK